MAPDHAHPAPAEISAAMAPGWERRRERLDGVLAPVREWLVAALHPAPGQTVLEIGAASGDTGLQAAAALGPGGRLISTDLTPEMVAVGSRRSAAVGARNVEHRLMDGQRIDLPDGSVDGILARFVIMLMERPAAALAEARRALRPGGRIALSVWGAPERNPWLAVGGTVLRDHGIMHLPEPGAPSPFALADADALLAMLADAGLADARLEEVAVTMTYRDAADYLDVTADTAPSGEAIRALPEAEWERVRLDIEAAMAPFASRDGLAVPGVAHCAAAAAP
jgi:SAM-dependent methyltransferase